MKKLIYFLLFLSSTACAQSGSKDATAFHSRVSDSTTVVKPLGWGTLYYNGQSNKWRANQNGFDFDLLPHFGTAQQVPFTNSTGTGFRYSTKLKWDDSYENLIAAPGITFIGPLNKFHQNSVLGEYHTFDLSTAGFGITDFLVSGYKQYATNAGAGIMFGQGNFQIDCYGCFTGGINSALAKPVSGTSFNDVQGAFIYSFTPPPPSGDPDTVTVAPPVRGNVYGSINISRNTSSQVNGHGALGKGAVILGGVNNHIPSNSGDNVILGGNGLSARAGENFQTYVENLNINSTPLNDDALTQVLVRNSSTGQIKYRNATSIGSTGWSLANGGTLTGANTIVGSTSNILKLKYDGLGAFNFTEGQGIWLQNSTPGVFGGDFFQQHSPSITLEGQSYASTPAASQSVKFQQRVTTQQGSAIGSGMWGLFSSVNAANYNAMFQVSSSGDVYFGSLGSPNSKIIGGVQFVRGDNNSGITLEPTGVSIDAALKLKQLTASQITSNANNYSLAFSAYKNSSFRISSDAARNITGLMGGYDGKILIIRNVGSFPITFTHEDVNSTAANRITLSTGANISLAANGTLTLQYDATASRWFDVALR